MTGKTIFEELSSAITEHYWPVIENVHGDDPLSKVVLVYDHGQNEIVPPVMGVLTKAHEAQMRSSMQGDDLAESLWNPEEFTEFASQELAPNFDSKADKLFDEINQRVRSDRALEEQVVMAINDACERLSERLRVGSQNLATLVYATDPELVDLRTNVERLKTNNSSLLVDIPSWCT
jgi:hypothetical protein